MIPLGRFGEAEEYADLVAFLVSARATYITGASINMDGGLCPMVRLIICIYKYKNSTNYSVIYCIGVYLSGFENFPLDIN